MEIKNRYTLNTDTSRKEEICLLQGRGCFWKKCRFCNYYLDTDSEEEITALNETVLNQITGETKRLTVLNSGSYFELPEVTRARIKEICANKGIKDLTIESHYKYKDEVVALKEDYASIGINLHARIGVETFDTEFREEVLLKGFSDVTPEKIAEVFDECCLLFGVKGQSIETLKKDLKLALELFNDVYLNIYHEISGMEADEDLIRTFSRELLEDLKGEEKLHVLINTTDLGVG